MRSVAAGPSGLDRQDILPGPCVLELLGLLDNGLALHCEFGLGRLDLLNPHVDGDPVFRLETQGDLDGLFVADALCLYRTTVAIVSLFDFALVRQSELLHLRLEEGHLGLRVDQLFAHTIEELLDVLTARVTGLALQGFERRFDGVFQLLEHAMILTPSLSRWNPPGYHGVTEIGSGTDRLRHGAPGFRGQAAHA